MGPVGSGRPALNASAKLPRRHALCGLLDYFPDLRFEQCPHGASFTLGLVVRIVPDQRQEPNDDVGSDWNAQRVRSDLLTELEAMCCQLYSPPSQSSLHGWKEKDAPTEESGVPPSQV
jgi:hypothetical protein